MSGTGIGCDECMAEGDCYSFCDRCLEAIKRRAAAAERERIKGLIADRRIYTESSAVDMICEQLLRAIDGGNVAPCRVCEVRKIKEEKLG